LVSIVVKRDEGPIAIGIVVTTLFKEKREGSRNCSSPRTSPTRKDSNRIQEATINEQRQAKGCAAVEGVTNEKGNCAVY